MTTPKPPINCRPTHTILIRFFRTAVLWLWRFLPLTVFTNYAAWSINPEPDWLTAYKVGGIAALLQLLILIASRVPLNKICLGVNLYLMTGATAAFFQFFPLLDLLRETRETALLAGIFLTGVVFFFTDSGCLSYPVANIKTPRTISLLFLTLMAGAFGISAYFQGRILFSAVLPIIALTAANRFITRRVRQTSKAE